MDKGLLCYCDNRRYKVHGRVRGFSVIVRIGDTRLEDARMDFYAKEERNSQR